MNPSKADQNLEEKTNLFNKGEKKQKSIPKFNRKGEVRLCQKKRSIDFPGHQHRISYISPGKMLGVQEFNQSPKGIESPTFQKVMHRFSVTNDDLFKFPKNEIQITQNKSSVEENFCSLERYKSMIAQKDSKIMVLKAKLDKAKQQNDKQKSEIQDLKQKIKQSETIKVFLLQRETFISQIMETNIRLNELLTSFQKEKSILMQNISQTIYEKQIENEELQKQNTQMLKRIRDQAEEINKYTTSNEKNQSKQSGNKTERKTSKKRKQNNQNINKINLKKNKKKSAEKLLVENQIQRDRSNTEFLPYDLNITQQTSTINQDSQGQNSENILLLTKSLQAEASLNNQSKKIISDCAQQHGRNHHEEKLISNLQQRIRYSEIQIDVLKKIKIDSSKVMKDNQHLKCQNRKLLSRIGYMTRTFGRRDNHSDSSLQLSLSPKDK